MGQHFVPQHYLRQFRIGNSPCIAVAKIDPFRWIGCGAIKGQCQRGEFYGKDSPLDGIYQQIEIGVAPALSNVPARRIWSTDEMFALRMLAVSLHLRTQKAVESNKMFLRMMADEVLKTAIDKGELPPPPGGWRPGLMDFKGVPGDLILNTIECDLEAATLRLKLLAAPSGAYFVTSDNPSVAMNQFAAGRNSLRKFVGFSKAGFQLLLPLSPKIIAFFYDPTVYKVGNRAAGCVPLTESDVEVLNSLQIQSADKCVFCHDVALEKRVANLCARFGKLRTNAPATVKRYPMTGPNEALIHIQHPTACLSRALSCVSYVRNVKARPGDKRDSIHSDLVRRLVDDLRKNPVGKDVHARIEKILTSFERTD